MSLISQDPPELVILQEKVKDLEAQLRNLEVENRQLQRQLKTSLPKLPPELPLELWTLIWEYALPDQRVLHVNEKCDERGISLHDPMIFFCSARPPAILHVCQESRRIALKYFTFLHKAAGKRGNIETDIYPP